MEQLPIIEAVAERDIDLILLEELHVSEGFRSWFLSQTFDQGAPSGSVFEVAHSVRHPTLGESDIVGIFEDLHGRRCALLIENKIDAPAQPDQADRYRLRGNEGVEAGRWAEFRTCILAPESYLQGVADASRYGVQLSYESIRDWFAQNGQNDSRSAYRSMMMNEAIEQSRRGYSPTPHQAVTQFWLAYWEIARVEFPELKMRKPSKIPAASDWPQFRPRALGPKRVIRHKLSSAVVDLEIGGAGDVAEQVATRNRRLLGDELTVERTGKSASIRLVVPEVDRFGEFSSQIRAARAGLSAAARLLELSDQIEMP